jgi:hypothetical protein
MLKTILSRKNCWPVRRGSLLVWLLTGLLVRSAAGFDTAPHYDLTHAVLTERGFSSAAVKIVQVENWMTDYYASAPVLGRASRKEQKQLEQLHFDNLYTAAQVAHYWAWFLYNVKSATEQAARTQTPLDTLTIMAISLHAVQDFYAHSNWVELHPRTDNAYRTDTFLNSLAGAAPKLLTGKYPADRRTGPAGEAVPVMASLHGGYANGLNKDSPIRAGWVEAYVFAYVASHELVGLIEQWSETAAPGHWDKVKQFQVTAADHAKLEKDLDASRNISMWVALDERADGHWKGDKSGAHHLFTAFIGKWETSDGSLFARQIKDGRLSGKLSENLYSQILAPALPQLSRFSLRRRAIVVRTTSISALNVFSPFDRIDPNGKADFYAVFQVGEQTYRDRVIQGADDVSGPWHVIHFVDELTQTIPLNISVWDEDEGEPGSGFKDDEIDINPQTNKYGIDLIISASEPRKTYSFTGAKPDRNRASIEFTVTQLPLR